MIEGGTTPEKNNQDNNNNNHNSKNQDDIEIGDIKSPNIAAGRQQDKSSAKVDYVSKAYTSNKADRIQLQNVKESPMVIEPNSNMNSPNN